MFIRCLKICLDVTSFENNLMFNCFFIVFYHNNKLSTESLNQQTVLLTKSFENKLFNYLCQSNVFIIVFINAFIFKFYIILFMKNILSRYKKVIIRFIFAFTFCTNHFNYIILMNNVTVFLANEKFHFFITIVSN